MAKRRLAKDIRALLLSVPDLAQLTDGERVHHLHVPEAYRGTLVWFGKKQARNDDARSIDTDEQPAYAFHEVYDVEVWSEDPDDVEDAASAIRSLDGFQGRMDPARPLGGWVQALIVTDAREDYVPRGGSTLGDFGLSMQALELEFTNYQEGIMQ